jgi:hypothetical protein
VLPSHRLAGNEKAFRSIVPGNCAYRFNHDLPNIYWCYVTTVGSTFYNNSELQLFLWNLKKFSAALEMCELNAKNHADRCHSYLL